MITISFILSACTHATPPTEPTKSVGTEQTEPTEPKPTEPKPTEPKPTEPKPTEPKPTEPKPTEPKPTEPKPTEPKPTEPKPTEPKPTEPKPTEPKPTEPKPTEPKPTEPKPTEPQPTEPAHSALYIPGVAVEQVITYFNEVCLDGEFVNSGDPSYVQKWATPIYYQIEGKYTDADMATLDAFVKWLNGVEGFPGIFQAQNAYQRNLRICFCTQQEMLTLMGPNFRNMDGAVTFWYMDNKIYDAIICVRTDLNQTLRNSVLLEEIYNGLGPIQDTMLRPDSIIYQQFSQPQWLSSVDELLLRLLYHPDMKPGMNAKQCETVIRKLYY